MSLPGRLLDIQGVRIFCHRAGKRGGASPLVLVHGYQVGHYSWRHVIPPLVAAGHEIVAIDLPGCGESDRPTTAHYRYDIDAYLQTLIGTLDALELPRATLVGHSMGGAISLVTAARHPERVDRLVVVDPVVFPFRLPPEGRLLTVPVVGEMLFRTLSTRGLVQRFLRRSIYRDPALVTTEWVDYLWERMNRPGGFAAAHASLKLLLDPSEVERSLRAVRAPTQIVWGEDDRLFPAAWARRLAEQLVGSEVRIVAACGHSPQEERPEEFLRAVQPFVAEPRWRAIA